MEPVPTVFVVGDVDDFREALSGFNADGRLSVRRFNSPHDALDNCGPQVPGCFVIDQFVCGADGLQIHQQLRANGCHQPFIFLLQHKDVTSAVEAMRHGALDCIERPLNCGRLLAGIQQAIALDASLRRRQCAQSAVLACVATLTARERQILELVAAGSVTKSIARRLDISSKTVEVHRTNIMRKMRVESAAALFHLVAMHSLYPLISEAG